MAFDESAIPPALFGSWRQLSGKYVDLETGEERTGLSKAPNGYIHFGRDGRLFNVATDSARKRPAGERPTVDEAEALYRTIIAYTGKYCLEGDQVIFDVDVSWNESWNGTRQTRTWELRDGQLLISARIVNPMTGKPAVHRLVFEKEEERSRSVT